MAIIEMASDLVYSLSDNRKVYNEVKSDLMLVRLDEIVNKHRNPSAHPEFMTIEKANECREIYA